MKHARLSSAVMRRVTNALLLLCLLVGGTATAEAAWYNASWVYRKTITIDYTKVGTGPHTNFPILVSITDSDLSARAQADADDILFTSADGTTKLDHEIESWSAGAGTLVAWVEIPSLSSSANTVIYMYYGNGAAASQQNVTGTWGSTFEAVWHLNGAFADATSHAYNGTNTGTTSATGQIGGGRFFDPSNGADYITVNGLVGTPANVTLSAWMRLDSADTGGAEVVSIGDHVALRGYHTGQGLRGFQFTTTGWTNTASGSDYRGTGWHYVAYTFNDAGNVQVLYADNAAVSSSTDSGSISYNTQGANTILGSHGNGQTTYDFAGILDEVRVSNSARSSGWLLTEYNNQKTPSTFYAVGTEGTNASVTLSGNVFEDVTYSGGVGRTKAASSGVNRVSARVELYTSAGAYSSATTTDASGNYSFSVTPSTSYTVRVVNSTVTSSLGGTSLLPVQTYRTTATTGSAVAVSDRVGGENPAYVDAGNGSTTLAALSSGSVTPQSVTSVTASTSNITGLDFGFNFSTIVNKNDGGQGSLRQFITNANGMSGTQTSVFMISGGSAVAGLRAGLTNQLTSGVAVITLTTALPQITGTLVLDGTSQTTNVGNTNAGTLGVGGTVGVDALTLSTVNRPEVEISVPSSIVYGLNIAASNTTISGLAIHGGGTSPGDASIYVASGSGVTISGNVIGASATSFTLPGTNPSSAYGIYPVAANSGTISNNLIGYTGVHGINFPTGVTGWTVSNNEIRGCGTSGSQFGGIDLLGTGHTISGNLVIASKAQGIDSWTDNNGSHTIVNNTITGNGVGVTGTREISGMDIVSDGNTIDRNIICANYGSGLTIGSTGTGNKITRNSIYNNGTITNDGAAAATGAVGIDLLAAGDNHDLGTAPYYTINDSGDGDSGGNNILNFPVLNTALINGSSLVLTGWARPGSVIELFIADGDASGFGEGQTYLTSLTEGGGSDSDATTGSYTNPVNGLNQGTDNTNKFTFSFTLPVGVSAGTKLTATATDGSNNTSEFSGVVTVAVGTVTLSGNVFEDVTYAGGLGRTKAASSGVNRASARVELYTSAGAYSSATTTDASGNYSFTVASSTSYTVRVVNSTVTSSLGGTSLLPVQTYRTTATTGSAVAVTDRVGGENPALADAGNGSTTLAALTAGSLTPQSTTSVTAGTSNITGLDFGFNFSTIVNKNDTGQGSLRQFITNANGMSGTQTSVFMISGGSAVAGLRAGLTNQLTSGVAVITLTTALPQITGTLTLDGTSQTTNVGNNNAGSLGTGGTVGVDAVSLSTVSRPEVEIVGTSSFTAGLDINAASTAISGLAIRGHGATTAEGDIVVRAVSGVGITGCVLGTTATSFSLPGSGTTGGSALVLVSSTSGSITNSLLGFTNYGGIRFDTDATTGWTVSGNEIRGVARAEGVRDGITLRGSGHAVSGNLIAANKGNGIESVGAVTSTTFTNNTISGNGVGTVGTMQVTGVRASGLDVTFDRNNIASNYGSGIMVQNGATGIRLTRNAITGNGTITNDAAAAATGAVGIDLLSASDDATNGSSPYYSVNDSGDGDSGGNNLFNTPVIDTATIVGANLELTGWVAAGATVEFFISDEHASGFGSGATFIGTIAEGSGGDLDATTGSYSGNVNCFAQGADASLARFKFVMAKPGSVAIGTKLTATATDVSNNTSEFCGNTTVTSNFPSFSLVKSAQTVSDPVNATTNPKAIPGGVSQYSIVVTNSNAAISDTNTFFFTDPIPTGTELYVGDLGGAGLGPVTFVDGATTCALTYTFTSLASTTDDLSFSNDSGATWTYAPTPDVDGFDVAVTNLRINPKGAFAKATCGNTPSGTFRFRVRVK